VLRFWESKFPQLKPLKRGGGRRYYRPEDIDLLRRIRQCLYHEGYTIRGVQKLLREGILRESLGRGRPVPTARSAATLAVSGDSAPAVATEPSPAALRTALDEVRRELSRVRDLLATLLRP
jgi:DNA-binding transcriptional MerR regulator